jgi:hypothetical protein
MGKTYLLDALATLAHTNGKSSQIQVFLPSLVSTKIHQFLLLPTPLLIIVAHAGPVRLPRHKMSPTWTSGNGAKGKLLGIESSDNQLAKFVILRHLSQPKNEQNPLSMTVPVP